MTFWPNAWIVLLALAATVSIAQAQDRKTPDPNATAAQDEAAGDATARFNDLFDQWKALLKDMRKLKSDYSKAKQGETDPFEQQWEVLIAKGNELLPRLREAGQSAYSQSTAVDPQLQRFLLKLAQDALDTDDYEIAYELSTSMLARSEKDKAPPPKELYNVAGVSAFVTNHYEDAERYLAQAKESGTLQGKGQEYESQLEKYKKLWETEQAVRDKEAEADDLPRVKIATTAGDMVIELFENEAPDTVGNFVSLVEAGFYDGLTFHRVLPGFMAQGGDPKGTGQGGPGYSIYCELDRPDYRRHFRGTLSMAHAGKDTGGSQFFVCFTQQPGLDGRHTAFGRVIEGFDALARIRRIDPEKPSGEEPTKITSMEVLRKRDHKYLPRKVE